MECNVWNYNLSYNNQPKNKNIKINHPKIYIYEFPPEKS